MLFTKRVAYIKKNAIENHGVRKTDWTRPYPKRWTNELVKFAGVRWMRGMQGLVGAICGSGLYLAVVMNVNKIM